MNKFAVISLGLLISLTSFAESKIRSGSDGVVGRAGPVAPGKVPRLPGPPNQPSQTPHATALAYQLHKVHVHAAALKGSSILVAVSHGGGCGDHEYHVVKGDKSCERKGDNSGKFVCKLEILDRSTDRCEAALYRTVEIKLENFWFAEPEASGTEIVIVGDGSEARVTLP